MGVLDAFSAEDRINVKFGDFYELVKGCTERDFIYNAVKTDVPHEYIRQAVTGIKENGCDCVNDD